MSDSSSLVNIGDLAKPVTTLIEKIADATGAICAPWQIKRVAKAEAEASKMKAITDIEINEIQQRAMTRLLAEETIKQENIENITTKALPEIKEDATPEEIENDWLMNFFDKCKLVSDEEMQSIWANLLAGEANKPGTFSKRTIELVSSLDKFDAEIFTNLCSFGWLIDENISPLIYFNKISSFDSGNDFEFYETNNLSFDNLHHLEAIGLIKFQSHSTFFLSELLQTEEFKYQDKSVIVSFLGEKTNSLDIGNVILTRTGKELASVCKPNFINGFCDFILNRWKRMANIRSTNSKS